MTFVPSFLTSLQPLAIWMTSPSFENFLAVACGWIFARHRTVTGIIQSAGAVGTKHYSAFRRFLVEES